MKRCIAGLLLGMLSVACSPSGSDGIDLGMGAEMPDQATPDALQYPPGLSLVAGGLGGSGNLDGTGAAARFNTALGLTADRAGNLYVADTSNHTIRKVVLATGLVTTLAGAAGIYGSTDGVSTDARFLRPIGVALDEAGNLNVTDSDNHTIRKVVLATGLVTTLAGAAQMGGSTDGTGATARFNQPTGVASDGGGNLYVTDSANHTIRKVVLATGMVTTLAGTAGSPSSADGVGAAARFNYPTGIVARGAGTLYVGDRTNSTIRKVVVATGAVTTLAGTARSLGVTDGVGAAARFSGPSGLALDGAKANLYVGDSFNSRIRKVVLATAAVTTLAGSSTIGSADGIGAVASFNSPEGVTIDGSGNYLYIADSRNHVIRKLAVASGAVSTLAGTAFVSGSVDGTGSACRFNDPYGVAVDTVSDKVYIADTANSTICQLTVSTGVVTTLVGRTAFLDGPFGVTLDGAGNLYVADTDGHTIRKVVIATGVVTTLAGSPGAYGITSGIGTAARFQQPRGVTADRFGNLYISDTANSITRKIVVATREVTTLAGTPGREGSADGIGVSAGFSVPSGVAIDAAGANLYVADTYNHTIRKVMAATGEVMTLAGTAGYKGGNDGIGANARFYYPSGITLDGTSNTLYIAEPGNGTIRKLQLSSGSVTTVVGVAGKQGVRLGPLPALLHLPRTVAQLSTGALIILDENSVLLAR